MNPENLKLNIFVLLLVSGVSILLIPNGLSALFPILIMTAVFTFILKKPVWFVEHKERHTQDGTVYRNQGEEYSQSKVQLQRDSFHDHFDQLDEGRNDDDEGNQSQILQSQRHEDILIYEMIERCCRGGDEDDGETKPHTCIDFLGNPQAGAHAEKPGQKNIVRKRC